MYRMRQTVYLLVEPEEASENPHSRLHLRVRRLWQDLLRSQQHEEAHDGAF